MTTKRRNTKVVAPITDALTMKKFGVGVSDDLAKRIEAPLEYGDSRSQRVADLAEVGLEVEQQLAKHGYSVPSTHERLEIIRRAIDLYAAEDSEGNGKNRIEA